MRSLFVIVALAALAACQQTSPAPASGSASPPSVAPQVSTPVPAAPPPAAPVTTAGKHTELAFAAGARRVAIGELDGHRELVIADEDRLRVVTFDGKELASIAAPGGCQVLVVADVDGKPAILAGWGMNRKHGDAKARISRYRLEHGALIEDVIVAPDTERAEIAAIVPVDAQTVLVAYYSSKYMVKSAYAHHGAAGWELKPIAELRMATSYARGDVDGDGKPELVVGRVYGDAKGVDGDAFVLADTGAKTPIPTTRGVHGLAIIDGAIWLGDGWHQNYVDLAKGLVTRAVHDAHGFRSELVEDTQGQYEIEKIVPATIDGKRVIVTLGSRYVRAYAQVGGTWTGLTIAGAAKDIAADGEDIVVVGDKSERIDLRGAAWR